MGKAIRENNGREKDLPDGELTYRLLKSANVNDIQPTMVRTSITKLNIDQLKSVTWGT